MSWWVAAPVCFAVSLAAWSPRVCAQKYQPPVPPLTTAPCVPTKKDPCVQPPAAAPAATPADKFPFPGDAPDQSGSATGTTHSTQEPGSGAAQKFPFPGEPEASGAGEKGANAPASAGGDTAQKFPFPGEPESASGASASSSSSSSSSSGGSDVPGDGTPATSRDSSKLTRTERRHLPKVEDLDHREAEDIDISRYYMSTGNYLAAYLRAKDAVKTIASDPDAHLALAEAAERMKKPDEAVVEYKAYIELDPDGEKVKVARKALAALGGK